MNNYLKNISLVFFALSSIAGCSPSGAEGVVRWNYRSCMTIADAAPVAVDASADGGGEAGAPAPIMPSCEPPRSQVANTASPTPRPNPLVLRCFSAVTGVAPNLTISVGFLAKDANGNLLELGASNANAVAATAVGSMVASCNVRITDGMRTGTGQCGMGCTVMITAYDTTASTISGSIRCDQITEMGTDRYWTVRNAEGVPSMSADFSLTKCEPAMGFTR